MAAHTLALRAAVSIGRADTPAYDCRRMPDLIAAGGTIIDAAGSPPRLGDIHVSGRRFVDRADPTARQLDAHAKWIVPGLIDLHTHSPSPTEMSLYIENGVTAVRFAGGHHPALLALRRRIEEGQVMGPRVFSCGP